MTEEQISPSIADSPAGKASSPQTFLGGGPKFNQAGYNAPLPGENLAEVKSQPQNRARVWMGAALAVVLIAALWVLYVHQPGPHPSGRGGISAAESNRPSDNPDAPASEQGQ